ncbi:hypothetical protein VF21_01625 [Pseudogymnoascus sp. 05NY08]|nr:hypothetical protein VF21_01625 [Pseudogymnoascus sp. 05NY08]
MMISRYSKRNNLHPASQLDINRKPNPNPNTDTSFNERATRPLLLMLHASQPACVKDPACVYAASSPYRVVVSQPTVSGEMQQARIPAMVVVFAVPKAVQVGSGAREVGRQKGRVFCPTSLDRAVVI